MFIKTISLIFFYLRPLLKWFLHKFTRLCELQRICYGAPEGSARAKGVERSLTLSKRPQITALLKVLDERSALKLSDRDFRHGVVYRATWTVMDVKKIRSEIHPQFYGLMWQCVEQIWGYRRLYHLVEGLRETVYNCDNVEHEAKLFDLWNLLMPDVKLETRITKQWQDIGFQGDDPRTDFRGMGLLGLENLLYFAREYNGAARHVLSHSLHPQHGYTFAIVGINLTSMAYKLLKSGAAKTHFYNGSVRRCATLDTFHVFYCYLFYEFDKYWMECKPSSIMDFSYIQERFEANIMQELADEKTYFKINLAVENV